MLPPAVLSNLAYTPPLDVSVGLILAIYAVYGTIAFTAVILLEAIALRLLRWGSFARSLLDSFLINLASSLVGVLCALFGWIAWLPDGVVGTLFSLSLAFALSVLVETVVLVLIRGRPLRPSASAAVVANAASYTGLALLAFVLFVLSAPR